MTRAVVPSRCVSGRWPPRRSTAATGVSAQGHRSRQGEDGGPRSSVRAQARGWPRRAATRQPRRWHDLVYGLGRRWLSLRGCGPGRAGEGVLRPARRECLGSAVTRDGDGGEHRELPRGVSTTGAHSRRMLHLSQKQLQCASRAGQSGVTRWLVPSTVGMSEQEDVGPPRRF